MDVEILRKHQKEWQDVKGSARTAVAKKTYQEIVDETLDDSLEDPKERKLKREVSTQRPLLQEFINVIGYQLVVAHLRNKVKIKRKVPLHQEVDIPDGDCTDQKWCTSTTG
jgi:hypothetical protein